MQVLITTNRIEIIQTGSVLPLIGSDMLSARYAESTVKQPIVGAADLSIFIRLQYQEKEYEIPLRSVSNQPRWTNNQDGAQQALLDILPVMRSANFSSAGGIFQITGDLLAGPGSGSVVGTLADTGVTPGTYNNPVIIVDSKGRILSITSTPPSGGDVTGPGSSTDDNIVLFNGATGKVIKDSGVPLSGVVTTDGNPAGISPIGSGAGAWPIELRRFVDSLAIKAQANTGSVSFNLVFSGLNKVFLGDVLGDPVEADVATASTANAIVRALATGKIDTSFLPDSIVGQLEYQGAWDAATNTQAIPAAATGNRGWYYVSTSSVAAGHGYPNIPNVAYGVGDWLVSNGTSWDKVDNTDAVSSVFGRLGAIVAAFGDYAASLISNDSTVAGTSVANALDNLLTAIGGKQDADATLTALAGLNSTPGLLEQTGADTFTKRAIGVAASTDILSRGDGDGRYLRSAGCHVPYVPPAGAYVIPNVNALALTTITGAADRMEIFPLIPSETFTVDTLGLEVTTSVAGSNFKLAIYADNAGLPDALIVGTGNLSGASLGVRTEAITPTQLVAGNTYWLALHASSNIAYRGIAMGGCMPIAYPAAGGTALSTHRRATGQTFGSGLPNPSPAGSLTGATIPAIMLRVA